MGAVKSISSPVFKSLFYNVFTYKGNYHLGWGTGALTMVTELTFIGFLLHAVQLSSLCFISIIFFDPPNGCPMKSGDNVFIVPLSRGLGKQDLKK